MNFPSRLIDFVQRIQASRLNSSRLATRTTDRTRQSLEFQKLEARTMLAGDVTVFIDNVNLVVIGDAESNQIQIIGNRNGSASVVGLEDTTINGGAGFETNFPGLRNAFVTLNQGNDEVTIQGARFNEGIVLQGNGGDDLLVVRNSSIGSLNIQGGNGDDRVEIENVFTINDSLIDTLTGDDLVAIYNHAVGGDFSLLTGRGDDTIAVDRLGMFGNLTLNTASGNDQVLVAGRTYIGRSSNLSLGTGDDFLGVMPSRNGGTSQLQESTRIDGGGGNDNIAFDAAVSMQTDVEIIGNTGIDGFSNSGADLSQTTVGSFENSSFDVARALDEVYTQLAEEGIDPTRFGGSAALIFGIEIAGNDLSFTEGQAGQALDPTLEINGSFETVITGATVSIGGFVANEDILEFTNAAEITGIFDDSTGVLTFSGNGTVGEYETVLQSISYRNSSESPTETDRTIDVEISTADDSTTASRVLNVIAVADAPTITVSQDPVVFDIDDANLTRPAVVDASVELTDTDTNEFTSATVQIVGGGQAGDVLAAVDADGITSSYDAASGLLTLTGASSLESYQTALQSVTFDNSADRAPLGVRTVRFEISDGQSTVSGDVEISIVAGDTIELATSPGSLEYNETAPATEIDPNISIATGDSDTNISGATVNFVSGFDAAQDTLSFTPVAGISGSYDNVTGVLTFTGDASVADYQTILRSVTFVNSSFGDFAFSTTDRVIEFAVERDGLIAASNRTITIAEIGTEQELIERFLEVNNLTSEVTDTGLHFIVNQEGDGNFPGPNSNVTVNYRGTLLNGDVFDERDGLTFNLQQVIEGWTEGIPQFSTGGGGILLIPSDLAYGAAGLGPDIPPFSTLFFEVELLSFT